MSAAAERSAKPASRATEPRGQGTPQVALARVAGVPPSSQCNGTLPGAGAADGCARSRAGNWVAAASAAVLFTKSRRVIGMAMRGCGTDMFIKARLLHYLSFRSS